MGISGLLPLLEKCKRPCNISEFRGATVAIDTYCWLHKGATCCAEQLAKGQQTDMYVTYCLKYVKLLLHYDIHPIMVFDGRNLPAKLETEMKRRQMRSIAKQRAAELLCLGKPEEARTYLKQCIDITPQMANALMRECRKLNVDCIVAPYESDAQLAFFNLKGIADLIITEDSDLILFGCKKVLYKMDLVGNGLLVESDKLYLAMNLRPDQFTFDKFRYMCILSGCDYVESLHGIGLKKALKFISLTAETDPNIFLDRLPRYLNMRHLNISQEYKDKFLVAEATLKHQTVFDPLKRKLVPLTDPEIHGTKPEYCKNAGEIFDDEKALQVALGNLHPNTFEKIDDWDPSVSKGQIFSNPSNSIWSTSFTKKVPRKSFMKSESKSKTEEKLKVSIEEEDRSKLEYDLKIENELRMYTEVKEVTETVECDKKEDVPQEKTSPILTKNPFLIKKKLSKFRSTVIEGKTIVKSRYFSSNSEPVENKIETINESTSTLETEEVIELTSSQKENKSSENKLAEATEYSEPVLSSCSKTDSFIVSSPSKKRPNEDALEKLCTEAVVDISHNETEEYSFPGKNNVEKKPQVVEPKKRKLGQCRTVGLPKQKNQPTLFHMFHKMKKNT